MSPLQKTETPARRLAADELKDPRLVLARFFDYASIDQQREQLWVWLKTLVAGSYSSKLLTKKQRYDLLYFYEQLQRLIEAAHLIHEQQAAIAKRKKKRQAP